MSFKDNDVERVLASVREDADELMFTSSDLKKAWL